MLQYTCPVSALLSSAVTELLCNCCSPAFPNSLVQFADIAAAIFWLLT